MDIRVLRYFLAVAREENITRAAERLHISQPSLSKQLMALESQLGKPLFLRGKRKIVLTEAGVLLRQRAEDIVALLDKTQAELRADPALLGGEIAVGGHPDIRVLRTAAGLRQEHPDIHFAFYSSDEPEVLERLDHGSLDFAVLLMPVDGVKYDYLALPGSARWGLLLPVSHPLAAEKAIVREALLRVPLLLHRRAGLQRTIAHWAQVQVEQLTVAATYNVINGDPSGLVRSGLGALLTTEDHLSQTLPPDLCFRPLDPPLEIHQALVSKRYAPLSAQAQAFLSRCREENG